MTEETFRALHSDKTLGACVCRLTVSRSYIILYLQTLVADFSPAFRGGGRRADIWGTSGTGRDSVCVKVSQFNVNGEVSN